MSGSAVPTLLMLPQLGSAADGQIPSAAVLPIHRFQKKTSALVGSGRMQHGPRTLLVSMTLHLSTEPNPGTVSRSRFSTVSAKALVCVGRALGSVYQRTKAASWTAPCKSW